MIRLSRRNLAQYAAEKLTAGDAHVIDQLAAYLVSSRRTKEADLLVRDIEKALEDNGTVVARVATAHELDVAELAGIESLLTSRYTAKKVALTMKVDEQLLGGMIIGTASDEFDGSLRRSINRLKAIKV